MPVDQRREALVDTFEQVFMRRQDEQVRGQQLSQTRAGAQEVLQRVGARLAGLHAHVRRDARKNLIAGDEHAQLGAVQTHVLRRMAVTDHRAPLPTTDVQVLTVDDAAVARRQLRDAAPELTEPVSIALQPLLLEAGAAVEADGVLRHI